MMHFFRVGGSLSKFLIGAVVEEIINIGGRKMESIAKYYIGNTSRGEVQGSKRTCSQTYGISELPLSPRGREIIEVILRTRAGHIVLLHDFSLFLFLCKISLFGSS